MLVFGEVVDHRGVVAHLNRLDQVQFALPMTLPAVRPCLELRLPRALRFGIPVVLRWVSLCLPLFGFRFPHSLAFRRP